MTGPVLCSSRQKRFVAANVGRVIYHNMHQSIEISSYNTKIPSGSD